MAETPLFHRLGTVMEITSKSEQRNPAGRTKVYSRCRIKWDDAGEPTFIDLAETYKAGQRTAVIYRGENYICDVNLETGKQSIIGDRVEGLAALVLVIAMPLQFILIGIPMRIGVTIYSKVTTKQLRKRVAAYVADLTAKLRPATGPRAAAV